MEELEEGEVGPEKAKQHKKGKEPKEKRIRSIDSREEATIRREQRTWSSRLESDGAPLFRGTQLFGSPNRGRHLISPRPCSSPFFCLVTWSASELPDNRISSYR